MQRAVTRTFRSGNSEAVRLPKDMAYGPGVELEIVRRGDTVTLRPVVGERPNAALVAALRALPRPSEIQERPPFEMPTRVDDV